MLLEPIVEVFFQQHYLGSTREVRKSRDNTRITVAVDTGDDYFNCTFNVLDAEDRKFAVYCDQPTPRSFAYAIGPGNEWVDIKNEVFSAAEILHQLDVYSEQTDEIDRFLSDSRNVELFFEKLVFFKNTSGNLWSVELNPMYEEPRMDDMFLSMADLSMIWNRNEARFNIYNGHDSIQQSSIDYTNGVVELNGKLLLFVLNPGATFYLAQTVPEKEPEKVLVYEGEIATDLGVSDSSDGAWCRFTVGNLDKLPAADILMQWNDKKIEGRAPLLLVNDGHGGFVHFTLKRPVLKKALKEISRLVEKNMSAEVAQFHLEYLQEMEL